MKFKKILLILVALLLVTGCNEEEKEVKKDEPKESISIMEYGDYKNIKLDDIEKITLYRTTIAGIDPTDYTSKEDIEGIYNGLKALKIGKKTDMACEDNSASYVFVLKNGEKYTINIECDWFIIGKDRYLIEK